MAETKLNPQEEIIKKYLDEQSTKDEALRALYVPAKIKDCFAYIKSEAKKQAKNGCAMIEDSVVYKWARDYFLEELPKKADKEDVEVVTKKAEVSPEVQDLLNKADKVISQKKEVTIIKNGTRYDKDGFGLLFDDID